MRRCTILTVVPCDESKDPSVEMASGSLEHYIDTKAPRYDLPHGACQYDRLAQSIVPDQTDAAIFHLTFGALLS